MYARPPGPWASGASLPLASISDRKCWSHMTEVTWRHAQPVSVFPQGIWGFELMSLHCIASVLVLSCLVMCVWTCLCMCGEHWLFCAIMFYLIFGARSSHWWPASSRDPTAFILFSDGSLPCPVIFMWVLRFELRSSTSCKMLSDPQNHLSAPPSLIFERRSLIVQACFQFPMAEPGLELMILLPAPPGCWDHLPAPWGAKVNH